MPQTRHAALGFPTATLLARAQRCMSRITVDGFDMSWVRANRMLFRRRASNGLRPTDVCAATSNFQLLEHPHGEAPGRAELVEPPERLTRGALTVPDAPEVGAHLNDRLLRAQAVKENA